MKRAGAGLLISVLRVSVTSLAVLPQAGRQSAVSPELLDVRSGALTLRAQLWRPQGRLAAEMQRLGKPHALKIYPPFGADSRAGHNLVFRSVRTWESDVFAFLDAHLQR